jgi:hypothetical protein
METINITPSWRALIAPMLSVLTNTEASHEATRLVESELERCARIADALPDVLDKILLCPNGTPLEEVRANVRQSLIDSGVTAIVEMKVNEMEKPEPKKELTFKERRQRFLDEDKAAQYLRTVIGNMLEANGFYSVEVYSSEGAEESIDVSELSDPWSLSYQTLLDTLVVCTFDIDGPVAFKFNITNDGKGPVIHALYDWSNAPEEIIFDYSVNDFDLEGGSMVEKAINAANKKLGYE